MKRNSIVSIRWFGQCESVYTMEKYNVIGRNEDKEASWAYLWLSDYWNDGSHWNWDYPRGLNWEKNNAGLLVQGTWELNFHKEIAYSSDSLSYLIARREGRLDNSKGHHYKLTNTLFMHTIFFTLLFYAQGCSAWMYGYESHQLLVPWRSEEGCGSSSTRVIQMIVSNYGRNLESAGPGFIHWKICFAPNYWTISLIPSYTHLLPSI